MRETESFRHDAIPDRLALTEGERRSVSRRVEALNRYLAPAEPAAIKRMVGMVKGLMASTQVDGQSASAILDGYAMVLAPYPQVLIEDVCARFLDGRLGNRVYAPTPAEIAHECRNAPDMIAAKAERYRLEAMLSVEVYRTPTAAEQDEIQAAYRDFVKDAVASTKMGMKIGEEPVGSDAAERAAARRELAERLAADRAERASRRHPTTHDGRQEA
ncbi:hypothetical protein [Methylobacterium sp. Leaf399]|uniref:hypothetical protein n=1 Tax=Methylobacterium sp. Leaf399 TaxID=1736364 RepID=UPI0012E3BB45|nr:hypothetical protein [Methylobacterium sp. Leaf399]